MNWLIFASLLWPCMRAEEPPRYWLAQIPMSTASCQAVAQYVQQYRRYRMKSLATCEDVGPIGPLYEFRNR